MKLFSVKKEYSFEAAHILDEGCNEACSSTIHGHSYRYTVEIVCKNLNAQGMVLDFKRLDTLAKPVATHWDHAILVSHKRCKEMKICPNHIGLKRLIETDKNPTAEWMAELILHSVYEHIPQVMRTAMGLRQVNVVVWETSKCCASCSITEER